MAWSNAWKSTLKVRQTRASETDADPRQPCLFKDNQVHSDVAAGKGGWHAVRRLLAAGKVKEGFPVHGSSRFPSGCPGPPLVSGCRVRSGLHLGLGHCLFAFAGATMLSRVVQSLAESTVTRSPRALLKILLYNARWKETTAPGVFHSTS